MRPFEETTLADVKSEITFIFAMHAMLNLKGKMRLFTAELGHFWDAAQRGMEIWVGLENLDDAMEKLELYYRKGAKPNSVLLLDPVLYRKGEDGMVPVGSGIIWNSIICPKGTKVPEGVVERLRSFGLFVDYIKAEGNERAGLKIFGFLRSAGLPPAGSRFNPNGNIVTGMQEIYDLVNIETGAESSFRPYMLSGLLYLSDSGEVQHDNFKDIFGGELIKDEKSIKKHALSAQKLVDAGICWQAYGRNQALLDRYGVDVANLERNLGSESKSSTEVDAIKNELNFIWATHKLHGIEGKMRIFTEPEQKPWRSKEAGFEFWFGPEPAELEQAAERIKKLYNGGVLPNSPALLDPVVHKQDENGNWVPVGSGIVWSTIFSIGREKLTEDMVTRMNDVGLINVPFKRGGMEKAGLKVIGFLDKPAMPVEGHKWVEGCREIFRLGDTAGEDYYGYYLLSGLEYLCPHGSFASNDFSEILGDIDIENPEDFRSRKVSMERIKNAAKCWEEYDRHHSLWAKFGIDVENLEDNLRYFNLCARDFELLDATNSLKDVSEMAKFELVVKGWIPRSAVTLMAATGGTGKSSMAHNLCVKASIDYREDEEPPLWLGSPLDLKFCQGMCVYFTGEDGPEIVNARAEMFDKEGRSKRVMFFRTDFGKDDKGDPRTISDLLMNKLHKMPDVSMVVIDPARKYLTGDEDNAEVVSEFFEAIEEFAISKQCGMIVVHHLAKGAKPKNSAEVLDCLRGSQVFIDRPRVVIGMNRDGAYTLAGLAKNNIPPQLGMVQGDRVFVRDPETLDLIWLPGEEGVRNKPISDEELAKIKSKIEKK